MASGAGGASSLSGRYVGALYDLAEDAKLLDGVAADLARLKALVEESPDLRRFVASPLISRVEQGKAMAALLGRVTVSDLTRRFVAVLARNRRLFLLSAIAEAYARLLAARRGEIRAEIVSAKALTDKQSAALGDVLRAALGKKVSMETKVDAALIAGLRVKIGSRMIDSSLDTKLKRLQLAMKGVD